MSIRPRRTAAEATRSSEPLATGSDEELAKLSGEGHSAAFEVLVIRHRPELVRQCTQLVGDADAEDAVQEALLRAYLALSRGVSVLSVRAWLRTIARNSALNLLQARMVRAELEGIDEPGARVAADVFDRKEQLKAVVKAIAVLPERQRAALVMRELEGLSYTEIESRLSASSGAVRQLLRRGRAAVRARAATAAASDSPSVAQAPDRCVGRLAAYCRSTLAG